MYSTAFRRRVSRLSRSARSLQTASVASTVNAEEIAHFSRLSSLWWDEHGEFALLHRMNPVRVQYIREKLVEVAREEQGEGFARDMEQRRDLLRGLDILDVGCGGGLLSESLARMGARTLGIDASESNIGIASTHANVDPELSSQGSSVSAGSLEYRNTSAEELLQDSKQYDVVCSMEVIEHVDNPAGFLSTCAELVKPGGHLFLSTIARTPLSYFLTILAAEYVLRKVTVGTHTYSKFINPSELVSFFQNHFSPPPNPEDPRRPWITRTYSHGLPSRTEGEVRGLVYVPWSGDWKLMPRSATQWGAAECNYLFWVRKPSAKA
ncbi:ubiquinone biosynthesis O-methyltransferase [Paxillus ammoniavirescens]|nr:ubiquinone biosynthesis O-methyltransferase [Paxillus ammoniavirescens]